MTTRTSVLTALVLVMCIQIAGLPAPSLAQQAEDPGQQTTLLGKNFTLQTGYKIWYAQWQTRSFIGDSQGSNQITSTFAPMTGPQITLGYNRSGDGDWFRGLYVSYQYLNAGFQMHEYGTPASRTAGAPGLSSALRTDTTITVSLPVWKGFGVFGGYYHSLQRFQFLDNANLGRNAVLRFKGPIVGGFGSVPVPDTRVSLYGNAGVGWLSVHPGEPAGQGTNQAFSTQSVMAYSVETGLNYGLPNIWKIKPSIQAGFRAQVLQQTYGPQVCGSPPCAQNLRTNDILWGPTFMIAATF